MESMCQCSSKVYVFIIDKPISKDTEKPISKDTEKSISNQTAKSISKHTDKARFLYH